MPDLRKKSTDPNDLPETYVIFITEHDILGEGLALYPVERCIMTSGRLFQDGAHIVYVNGAYRDNSPIGKLMHDFSCTNAAEMYYDVLADRMRFFKESTEGVAVMCKAFEEIRYESYREGFREGFREGKTEKTVDTAKKLLETKKLSPSEIAVCFGLELADVLRLQEEANSQAKP